MSNKYPEYIMKSLRQRRDLEKDDTSEDNEILQMSKAEVLDEVATWEGLINYGDTIKGWVEDIYGIDLDKE